MDKTPYSLSLLELPAASDEVLTALHTLQSRVDAERFPADPPVPLAVRLKHWRAGGQCWVVWSADRSIPVASVWVHLSNEAHDRHVVQFNMQVLPEYRRRGLGRQLLQALATIAQQEQRELLMTQTQRSVPAGAAFVQRMGASAGVESRSLQLTLDELAAGLAELWQRRVAERSSGFELGFWEGAYPEQHLATMARLHEVHNDAPHRGSTIGDTVITPQQLRQTEQEMLEHGDVRRTAYIREQATGAVVGFSEVSWNPQNPASVEQGTTAVLPAYRKRGFGHWLKVSLLDRLRREQPAARFVRTGNAADNLPMLNLNRDLGFKIISEDTWWEIPLENVQRYLERNGGQRR